MNSSVPRGRIFAAAARATRTASHTWASTEPLAWARSMSAEGRVVGPACRDHHVIDRRRQAVEELLEARPSVTSKAAVLSAPSSSATGCSRSGLRPTSITSAPSARARRRSRARCRSCRRSRRRSDREAQVRVGLGRAAPLLIVSPIDRDGGLSRYRGVPKRPGRGREHPAHATGAFRRLRQTAT